MFDELVSELSTTLSVLSLLFFVAVYLVVTVRAFRVSGADLEVRSRMALDGPATAAGRVDDPVGDRADTPQFDSAAVRG